MLPRRRTIIGLAGGCCAAIVLCPIGGQPTVHLTPIVSSAPPLFVGTVPVRPKNAALDDLHREASLALAHLRTRDVP